MTFPKSKEKFLKLCRKYYISEVLIFSGANLSRVNCETRILRLSFGVEYGQIPDRQTRFFSLRLHGRGSVMYQSSSEKPQCHHVFD